MIEGVLVAWNPMDGVGRIQLGDGRELRVGQSAFGRAHPAVGARCVVHETGPHPLGGMRATRVEIVAMPAPPAPLPEAITSLQNVMRANTRGSVREYDAWLAGMPPTTDHAGWLLERVRRSVLCGFDDETRAVRRPRAIQLELARLAEAHEVLVGTRLSTELFGVGVAGLPAAVKDELQRTIAEALRAWRDTLTEPLDRLRLHRVGRRLHAPELEMESPPALRCEPFGTSDELDAKWLRRLAAWTDAARGRRALALGALGLDGERVTFHPPDRDALIEAVTEYELQRDVTFPRPLAAMLCVADGVSVADWHVIAPFAEWGTASAGLVIGCGSDRQGSLILRTRKLDLLTWRVIDHDDDGTTMHEFPTMAVFFDAILGL